MSARARPSAWLYVLCYALWLLTLALGVADVAILREWAREEYVRSGLDRWGFVAADQFVLIVATLALLCGMIGLDYYYRGGLAKGLLWRRFRTTAGILLVVPAARLAAGLVQLVLSA